MDSFQQKAHFLRRTTGGATLDELNNGATAQTLLTQWLDNLSPSNVPVLPGITPGANNAEALDEVRQRLFAWLINQIATAANPLQERIVNFWRDHFIVGVRKTNNPYVLADYENRLRTYALGDFRELLYQVSISPAMLLYLDGRQNRRGNINENFSREVKELFTIGRGNYTETDVQEGARALTGWSIQTDLAAGTVTSSFQPNQHDSGSKVYLGKTGNFKTEDVVEILANDPNTGRTLARELWSTFVYPNPEPPIVERLAEVYRTSQRNLLALVEAVFSSPEFYDARSYRSQIRSPQEFMFGSIRQLGLTADPTRTSNALRSMGQNLYNPPSVEGWPSDDGWLTAPSLLTRINVARQMTLSSTSGFGFDPRRFTKDSLVTLLLDGAPDGSIQAANPTLSTEEFAAFILSTPLYQLA